MHVKNTLFLTCLIFFQSSCNFSIKPENVPLLDKVFIKEGNYYDITINDIHFSGSRSWLERWNIIKEAYNYKGLKVLDLGCFLGLNSICIKKYGEAQSVTGVDYQSLNQAVTLAKAFETDINFLFADFNDDNVDYENVIGFDYDIVFCLSLFHWVHHKDRFLAYLSKFNTIIFEGHQPAEVEIERFEKLGYSSKILGTSFTGIHQITERGRTIILFYK